MSQQVKVSRSLEFLGDANQELNVKGYMNPEKINKEYNYTELALDDTNKYTPYLDTTSTVALGSGGLILTTAATDTKTCTQSQGGIWWYPAKKPVVEIKLQIDVITTVPINAGFTDAVSEGSATLPFLISGTTIADTCTNGVMFCFDTNQTTDRWYVVNTNAGTQAGTITANAPVAATDATLRIEIDALGNARYYYNGVQVGYKALATAVATPLVPYVGIRNNSAAAHVATVRYVRLWCDA